MKIDLPLPIVASNLMIEFADFYENYQASTETLQCPRCSASVPANPGVCGNCGENVYQCHKCRWGSGCPRPGAPCAPQEGLSVGAPAVRCPRAGGLWASSVWSSQMQERAGESGGAVGGLGLPSLAPGPFSGCLVA